MIHTDGFSAVLALPYFLLPMSHLRLRFNPTRARDRYLPFSRIHAGSAKGLSLAAREAVADRQRAIVRSALIVQGAGRILIARRTVSRRREAIAALQAFYRGWKGRVVVRATLERRYRDCLRIGGGDGDSLGDDTKEHGRSSSIGRGEGQGRRRDGLGDEFALQVGRVSRRDVPMDTACPGGFDRPNLAAFLWNSGDERDGVEAEPPPAPNSEVLSPPCINTACDGAVCEVSAGAVITAEIGCKWQAERGRTFGANDTRSTASEDMQLPLTKCSSLLSRWVPAAVAPENLLARALECSTLVVNSPSFGSVCARRLFSRIGRTTTQAWVPTSRVVSDIAPKQGRDSEDNLPASIRAEDEMKKKSPRCLQGGSLTHVLVLGHSPIGDGGLSELCFGVRRGCLPRLTTLVLGGPGCRVGPRGVTALATALSSPGCSCLQSLSLSNCCLGRRSRRRHCRSSSISRSTSSPLLVSNAAGTAGAAHAAWDCLFRHLQRLPALSSLSLENCGLEDCDIRSASIAIQILPAGRLRCLRLNGNFVGAPGLRFLLRALTSRRMRLPALWLRQQRPALVESKAREAINEAFDAGLFAEVRTYEAKTQQH